MCYQQGKMRNYYIAKTKGGHSNPLIKDKKNIIQTTTQKQNQKHNQEIYYTKGRSLIANPSNFQYQPNPKYNDNPNPTLTTTIPNSHQNFNNNHNHNKPNHDRYNNNNYQNTNNQNAHINYTQTVNKGLTFGTVKTTNNHNHLFQEQINPTTTLTVVNQNKRPLQMNKNNLNINQKDNNKISNFTDRSTKPLIDRMVVGVDKKDKNVIKPSITKPNNNNLIVVPIITTQPDDFTCNQDLDFKPVEKKSLIPQKKYTNQKTTSKFDFARPKKIQKKNDSNLLKEFQNMQKVINMNFDVESLMIICQKQEEYAVNPNYLQKNHKSLTWWSRAILVDWMRHICYQFGLQRDTYHIAVVLLDNYLERSVNTPKSILQAIGATSLFIASKLEQFQCKQSKQFAKSTNNSCSIQDIHELQIKIVKTLRFKLNPPTLFSLSNKIMSQWDLFLLNNDHAKLHPVFNTKKTVFFKQLDQNSYKMFRELMQMIDCSLIDIQTAQYKPKMLICSFMYLLIGREMGFFDQKEIVTEFPGSSLYLLDQGNDFNDFFRTFLEYVFGFSLFEILPTVQYCATYFSLSFTYQTPIISQDQDLEAMSLQEYCAYQTYNSGMIKTIKNRYRGLY